MIKKQKKSWFEVKSVIMYSESVGVQQNKPTASLLLHETKSFWCTRGQKTVSSEVCGVHV